MSMSCQVASIVLRLKLAGCLRDRGVRSGVSPLQECNDPESGGWRDEASRDEFDRVVAADRLGSHHSAARGSRGEEGSGKIGSSWSGRQTAA